MAKEPVEKTAFILKRMIHRSCKQHFGINRNQIMRDEVFPTACILRDPVARIVSCYLDKFAKPVLREKPFERFVIGHIEAAQIQLGITPELERSISFSEFIDYIFSRPRWASNSHWRPQSDFIPTDHTDIHFGTVENLPEFFDSLGLSYSSKNYNKSFGGKVTTGNTGDLANHLPKEIGNEDITDYGRFLTDAGRDRVQRVLAEDIKLYSEISKSKVNI